MPLLYFILGIIFISYITPLFDSLLELLLAYCETKKAKYIKYVNEVNLEIENATLKPSPNKNKVIGFGSRLLEDEEEEAEL